MADAFTSNIGLDLQQTGSNANTWGITLNTNFTDLDTLAGGRLTVDASGSSDITLTDSQALNIYHGPTGTLTGNINYIFPAARGGYFIIYNGTSGAYTLTAKISGGTGVVVPQGKTMFVFSNPDATALASAFNYLSALTLGTALPIASGGTGQATQTTAFDGLSPTTTKGDLIVNDGTNNVRLGVGADGTFIIADSSQSSGLKEVPASVAIVYVIDGGGSAITTGVKGDLLIPFACTINSNTLQADQSGSIVVDIWAKAYATSSPPTVANTITASALPTLSSAQSSQDATLTGWTTTIAANTMLRFNVNSATTVTRVTITLKVTRT